MGPLLHLRVGRFFEASSLGRAQGLAATLEMTARLDELAHRSCRAIEWFSATQAWCDLESGALRQTGREAASPWVIAERLHHEIKSTLSIEVACGVASSRSASLAASALARPNGLVVALPGHEAALIEIARKDGIVVNAELDATPLKPSYVPRAIVRSAEVETIADSAIDSAIAPLVDDARRGMAELGMLAATVRVQFSSAEGVREHFVTLPDATSLGEIINESAYRLGRRVAAGIQGPGRLSVSLSHLVSGPSQGSLFGWRYDRHGHAAQRLA
jgi:hypothetical protein